MAKKKHIGDSDTSERMIHIRLKADIHRLLRVHVAEKDVSIQDLVVKLIEREIIPTKHNRGT